MVTALILAISAFICGVIDELFGRNMFNRPIITGVIVGLVLGDIQSGIIIGATLELAFIGLFAVGAALPPEILTGGVLGTALAIASNSGVETALLLAFPIASLALVVKNLYFILIVPLFLHKADAYAEKGSFRGIEAMHLTAGTGLYLLLAFIVFISFYVGSDQITSVLEMVPEFIQTGLEVAAGILPALGFALLGRMIMNKKVIPYFFIGFATLAYFGVPVIAIALIGAMVAIIIVNIDNVQHQPKGEGVIDDDDF